MLSVFSCADEFRRNDLHVWFFSDLVVVWFWFPDFGSCEMMEEKTSLLRDLKHLRSTQGVIANLPLDSKLLAHHFSKLIQNSLLAWCPECFAGRFITSFWLEESISLEFWRQNIVCWNLGRFVLFNLGALSDWVGFRGVLGESEVPAVRRRIPTQVWRLHRDQTGETDTCFFWILVHFSKNRALSRWKPRVRLFVRLLLMIWDIPWQMTEKPIECWMFLT